MNLTVVQFVQAIAFIAVILAVEGLYLFIRSGDRREKAANRRMKIAAARNERVLNPELFRRQIEGGAFSGAFTRIAPSFTRLIWRAAVDVTPAVFVGLMGVATFLIFALMTAVVRAPIGLSILVGVVLGCGAPYLFLKVKAGGREQKFADQMPTAIDIMVRGLQAGHPVPVAIEMVAREIDDPLGSEFGHALDEMNYGQDRGVALQNVASRFNNPEYKFLVSTIEMQAETGGNLAEILTNLSRVIRERANMRKKVHAISSEGRMSCIVVGALPFAVAFVILLIHRPFYLDVINDPLFWAFIGGGFVLWAVGIVWIWRMVNFKF